MALYSVSDLPDSSRLWIFPGDHPIEDSKIAAALEAMDRELEEWKSHGNELHVARELRYGQFLLVAVDESNSSASGCSIDTLTRAVQTIGMEFGVRFPSSALVSYRQGNEISTVSRAEFKKLVEAGAITADTVVFNNMLTELGQLRAGNWEVPARASWHINAFPFAVLA